MISSEVTEMLLGGLQMHGFYLVVELEHGGSVTNRANPSTLVYCVTKKLSSKKILIEISFCLN